MREVVKYVAFDGSEFDSKAMCAEYEKIHFEKLAMYNRAGNKVEYAYEAYIVYLGTFDTPLGDLFIELCKTQNESYEGIDANDSGWFYWNEFTDRYDYLEFDLIAALSKICEKGELIQEL